jgi:hypothetical protein
VQPAKAVSSRAGQERGCGEVSKQDLKTANMCGATVYIPPPFQADPHALWTTLFERGEDLRYVIISLRLCQQFIFMFMLFRS